VAEEAVSEAPAAMAAETSEEADDAPAEKKKAAAKKEPKLNDLKIIEGVGPKIEQLLKENGINTWEELAEASADRLKEILDAAGSRYQIHDPSTWPAQARFAAAGQWDDLKDYQEMLIGGRDVTE
ncbi:MAG: 50S ribosomal protein L27, partial [Saprospiraceae bacterium]|nr:50S ribosomal protein L27 [Saprospiraceae bacterium]